MDSKFYSESRKIEPQYKICLFFLKKKVLFFVLAIIDKYGKYLPWQ